MGTPTDEAFPLADWFDVSQPIPKGAVQAAAEQMAFYAAKDGEAPRGKRWKQAVGEMRRAVRAHNERFSRGRATPDGTITP